MAEALASDDEPPQGIDRRESSDITEPRPRIEPQDGILIDWADRRRSRRRRGVRCRANGVPPGRTARRAPASTRGERIHPSVIIYLNRLADLLWLLGRLIERDGGVDASLRRPEDGGNAMVESMAMTSRRFHGSRAAIARVRPVDPTWRDRAEVAARQTDEAARSLGRLEWLAARLCAIQRTVSPLRRHRGGSSSSRPIMASTEEGVSAYPSAVTAQMVGNFLRGGAAINVWPARPAPMSGSSMSGVAGDIDVGGNGGAVRFAPRAGGHSEHDEGRRDVRRRTRMPPSTSVSRSPKRRRPTVSPCWPAATWGLATRRRRAP